MTQPWSVKRLLLQTVIGALVVAALVGIYVFVFGTFGETEVKILLTTLSISYFSVTSLACAAAHEKKRYVFLTIPGLILGIAGFVVFIPSIWAGWWESSSLSKAMAILAVFSFSLAQACLLSLASLPRQVAWVFYAAVACILVLAAIIAGMIIADSKLEWLWRGAGIVAILDGCLSLCVPILCRLGGRPEPLANVETLERIELVCPRCHRRGTYAIGTIECRNCSLVVRVQIGAGSQ